MGTPSWVVRIWEDLKTKPFIPIKILFFLQYGASAAMFPFLTLQARKLGIDEIELGAVYASAAAIALVGPALTGMLADRIGNFKILMSVTLVLSGVAAITYDTVPYARLIHNLPDTLPLKLTYKGNVPPTISLPYPLQCDYLPSLDKVSITTENCSFCDPTSAVECAPPGPGACEGQQLQKAQMSDSRPSQFHVKVVTQKNVASTLEVTDWLDTQLAPQVDGEGEGGRCGVQCEASGLRESLCSNTQAVEVMDPIKSFWCFLFIQIFNMFALAASFTLFDGAVMAIIEKYEGQYGLQRLYGNVGALVLSPISGTLIDVFTKYSGESDYRPSFYLYCGLKVIAAMIVTMLDLDFRRPSKRLCTDLRGLLKNPEVLTFLVAMMISGISLSVVETFLFWLLEDLGADSFLMGMTVSVGSLAGIPVLMASEFFFKKLGYVNTIVTGFAFYVARMLGYSFIIDPWWSIPFEALECFTVSLKCSAAVAYAADMSTPSTLATLQGIQGGLYHGVGRGVGSLLGGFLIGPLGTTNTFRIMACVSGVTGIVYFILNRLFFRKAQKERLNAKQEENGRNNNFAKEEENPDKEIGRENRIMRDSNENVSLNEFRVNGLNSVPSRGQVNNAFEDK